MGATTTRLGLPYPFTSDANNVPSNMQSLANRLDAILPYVSWGTFSARPAFGNPGFMYFATNVANLNGGNGVLYWDTGTGWVTLNPAISVGGTPSTSEVGDTASNGVSTVAAASDHTHARENWAGSGGNYGTSASPSRADHTHLDNSGRVYATNGGSVSSGQPVIVLTNHLDFLSGTVFQGSGGLVVAASGRYLANMQAPLSNSGTGFVQAAIMKTTSGTTTIHRRGPIIETGVGQPVAASFSAICNLAAGDIVNIGLGAITGSGISTDPTGDGTDAYLELCQLP